MSIENYRRLLDEKGVPLTALYVDDVALDRESALNAVSLLKDASVPILGGDAYYYSIANGNIERTHTNWYCDPRSNEVREDYVKRSWIAAADFINLFPDRVGTKPLFVIVIG